MPIGDKKMTLDDHKLLGANLLATRRKVLECVALFSKSSKESRRLMTLVKAIDSARCQLDAVVFRDYRKATKEDLLSIYFPRENNNG